MKNVCVVLVNWNAWRETVECLESVLRMEHSQFTVVLCDNGSTDGSVQHIRDWATEGIWDRSRVSPSLAHLTSPGIPKPVRYREYSRAVAEQGGIERTQPEGRLVIVALPANMGFAGGTNVGLRYALARGDFDYIWLLNNDTVVRPNTLGALVQALEESPDVDMAGPTIVFYSQPSTIQARGGSRYNKVLGITSSVGLYEDINREVDTKHVEHQLDYIVGASLFVRKSFVERVGLLDESFFLYYEEIDWALRGSPCRLGYVRESIVYHREGAALGSSSQAATRSELADYYYTRNRIRVTRKHFPWFLVTVYFGVLVSLLRRITRRQWKHLRAVWKGCRDGRLSINEDHR